MLDVDPGGEVGVFQRAFADVERCVLIQRGGVEGDREEDVEVETVVVECPVIVVEAVLLAECPDADVVPPVDLQVETDLPFALAERDRLREGVRVDPAADADALFQLVVAEYGHGGRGLCRGVELPLVVEESPQLAEGEPVLRVGEFLPALLFCDEARDGASPCRVDHDPVHVVLEDVPTRLCLCLAGCGRGRVAGCLFYSVGRVTECRDGGFEQEPPPARRRDDGVRNPFAFGVCHCQLPVAEAFGQRRRHRFAAGAAQRVADAQVGCLAVAVRCREALQRLGDHPVAQRVGGGRPAADVPMSPAC